MAPKNRLNNLVICFSGTFDESDTNIKRWTESNGGTYTKNIDETTTHLVVTRQNWRDRVSVVKAALRIPEIKIFDYEWFEDKLRLSGRVSELKYSWKHIDEEALKQEQKDQKAAAREKKRALKEKEKKKKDAERIDWGGALLQHTNVVARRGDDDDDSENDSSESSQHAEEFARGAKMAKEDLMSDSHHIYVDETAFSFDVILTKASTDLKRLDRARITLYESNPCPHSYACVVKMGESVNADHKIHSAMGSNYATAFRAFRKNFEELTGVTWEDRVNGFGKRDSSITRLPSAVPRLPVNPTPNKPRGKGKEIKLPEQPTPEQLREQREQHEKVFAAMKYVYRLPLPGEPRGKMVDPTQNLYRPSQNNKTTYQLFGAAADKGKAAIKRQEALVREKQKGLKKLGQKIEQAIIIDDSDDESDSENGSEDDDDDDDEQMLHAEDEEMEDAGTAPARWIRDDDEDGYVAVSAVNKDVKMEVLELDDDDEDEDEADADAGAEYEADHIQDYNMVDAVIQG